MKVAVGASSFAQSDKSAFNKLIENGIEIILNPYGRKLTKEEIIEHLKGVDGLLAGLELLDEEVFKSVCPQLKAIARIGIGMDNVDLKAAEKFNIKVSNTPDGPTQAVTEMTVAALMAILRNIIPANKALHDKEWKKEIGTSILGLKVFIVGYGRIGEAVSKILKLLGAEISVYDPYKPQVSIESMEEGLKWADVISLHASGNEEIISYKEIEQMKDGVIILNSSRGGLINENALYEGLKSGKIANCWLDVYTEEPYKGKLCELENAVLTPHISTYSDKCRKDMEMQAVVNLLKDLNVV